MADKKTVQVRDLKKGQNLGNCIILADPTFIGNYLGQPNRMAVQVRFNNGTESTRVWGKFTTVKIIL